MQLRDAAAALGVHYQTAYGWVRDGALPARKSGRGYEVAEQDVRQLAELRATGTPPPSRIAVRDWSHQSTRLQDALVAGDETAARRRLGRLIGGIPVAELCEHVIAPALRQIGDDWAAGIRTVAEEHRASMIAERLIVLAGQQPQGRPRGIAVVTTPPGERHGLPALMAAVSLRQDRWLVHHLACDLPVAEIAAMTLKTNASVIVLSAATVDGTAGAESSAGFLDRATGARVLAGRPGDRLADLLRLARAPGG